VPVPFLPQKNKNKSDSKIHQNKHRNQEYLYHYITQQRLSDSLELLEMQGYRGDDAIRRIQYLQMEEVC
jgi:hypothetical protein